MKTKKFYILTFFFLIGLVFLSTAFISCGVPFSPGKTEFRAKNGVMDLSEWNFSKPMLITLDGQWEFYSDKKLNPSSIQSDEASKIKKYITVPSFWKGNIENGPEVRQRRYGVATYRLKVRLPEGKHNIGFHLLPVYTAYTMWLNGDKTVSVGEITEKLEGTRAAIPTKTTYKTDVRNSLDIIIQVANSFYRKGGIGKQIYLGSQETIKRFVRKRTALNGFIVGALLLLGFYHIVLFFADRKHPASLYIGILCIVSAFRILCVSGEYLIYDILPNLNLKAYTNIQIFGIYLLVPAFMGIIRFVFPKEVKLPVIWLLQVTGPIFIVISIILPYNLKSPLLTVYYPFIILGVLYSLFVVGAALYHRHKNSVLEAVSMLFFLSTAVHDMLIDRGLIAGEYLLSFGLIGFMLVQSVILMRQYKMAFRNVEQLSQKLQNYSEQLKKKNQELRRMDILKDKALADTSHELRTPLNGIIGVADSLWEGAAGELNKEQKENINLIIHSGMRLKNIINDILDYSKLRHNMIKLNAIPLRVAGVADTVVKIAQILKGHKDIQIINNIPRNLWVQADEMRLEQVFFNLLGNAIKQTKSGSITLSGRKSDSEGYVELMVEDTGKGFSAEDKEKLFQEYMQIQNGQENYMGGTGIGLPITKKLIELHGGNINATSELGKGSKFIFTLSAADLDIEASKEREAVEKIEQDDTMSISEELGTGIILGTKPVEVILADSDVVSLKALQNLLGLEQYTLRSVQSGEELLDTIRLGGKPDIVLLDYHLPDWGGFETLKKIREKYSKLVLPVIILTTVQRSQDMMDCFVSGANDYLEKPFSKQELYARIENHLHTAYISNSYRRFVPEKFLEFLNKQTITDVNLGDHSKERMTLLFADICNFATIAGYLNEEEVFTFLNNYYAVVSPIVRRHGGFVDKYLGDTLMVLFPENPENALKAALEIRNSISKISLPYSVQKQFVDVGIGIHTGELMLGTIGEPERMENTVISESVHCVERLVGMTKIYSAPILISSEAMGAIDDEYSFRFRFVGREVIKGKKRYIAFYELLGGTREEGLKYAYKDEFARAVSMYYREQYDEAMNIFISIVNANQSDETARYYLDRCAFFKERVENAKK